MKNKRQNVQFKSIEEFLDFLPENELEMVNYLRSIVLDCIPNVREHLAFNVPYFKRHSNICFIWPSSVLWGKKKTYEGVRFGFTKGNLLPDDLNFLDKGSRKQVYWKDFTNLSAIEVDILKMYLYEAALIDQEQAKLF